MTVHHSAVSVPNGLSPEKAYDLLVRNRCNYYAAQVARDYELGAEKMLHAALTAYRHFDRFGFEDAARKVADEFGLTAEMIRSMYAAFSGDVTVVRNVMTLPPIDPPQEGGPASN